jgi:hypothetical protein
VDKAVGGVDVGHDDAGDEVDADAAVAEEEGTGGETKTLGAVVKEGEVKFGGEGVEGGKEVGGHEGVE